LENNYNILICPLEWGLGHAGRMIPMAKKLQAMNAKIFIGAGEEHLSLFRKELQEITYINFPGFMPGYSRIFPQYLTLFLKIPLLFYHIIREHISISKIIRDYGIDILISDNRFGLWNRKIKTVYITHMPLIPFPKPFSFLEFIGVILHRTIIKKYSYCFIPDLPGSTNVSGRLSHDIKLPENVRYIGILSRFSNLSSNVPESSADSHLTAVILSGPEPQKSILKNKLTQILKKTGGKAVILEGHPGRNREVVKSGDITFYNHLPALEMMEIIKGSERIITRSGYSTIMELISLNCSALIIPTVGQPEQEYLAEYLSSKGWFSTISQRDLKETLPFSSKRSTWPDLVVTKSKELLNEALAELLKE
jgi:predicted glycosyltransferase